MTRRTLLKAGHWLRRGRWRAALAVLIVCAAVGCGKPAAPPPAPAEATAEGKTIGEAASEAVGGTEGLTMSGIKLFLYDNGAAIEGMSRKPVLRIEADTFVSTGEKSWTFEKAHAFMLSSKTQEEWEMESARGSFTEDQNAFLEGGVVARLGTMTVKLEDISFETPQDGTPKAAFSDKPVTVDDPAMTLAASSVKLFPDEKRFELTEVTGSFRFKQDAPAAAEEAP